MNYSIICLLALYFSRKLKKMITYLFLLSSVLSLSLILILFQKIISDTLIQQWKWKFVRAANRMICIFLGIWWNHVYLSLVQPNLNFYKKNFFTSDTFSNLSQENQRLCLFPGRDQLKANLSSDSTRQVRSEASLLNLTQHNNLNSTKPDGGKLWSEVWAPKNKRDALNHIFWKYTE